MPKGVRRNPFQTLLTTAEKQLQIARERLASAEGDAECIHQKRIRVARMEHDEWTKMVKQLKTSLTIPQLRAESNPPVRPNPSLEQPMERVDPVAKMQSNNDAAHGPNGQPDAGDRIAKRGPMTTKPRGRPGQVSRFDKCPGLSDLRCTNSKPFDSALCGRCAAIRGVRVAGGALGA